MIYRMDRLIKKLKRFEENFGVLVQQLYPATLLKRDYTIDIFQGMLQFFFRTDVS